MPDGTQIPGVQGPFPSFGAAGAGDVQAVGFGGPGHGHCTLDTPPHHNISVGIGRGAVPEECFPYVLLPRVLAVPRRVFFANEVTIMDASPDLDGLPDPVPVDLPDIQIHDPVYPRVPEEDPMDVSTKVSELNVPLPPPPPGFESFVWLKATGGPGGDPSLFDFLAELPGWPPMGLAGASGDQLSLPISLILSNSPEESVVGSPATSLRESDTPSRTGGLPDTLSGSPPIDLSQQTLTSPAMVYSDIPDCPASRYLGSSPEPVPCWWLAREGPFLSERLPSSLNCFGVVVLSVIPSDYTRPSGKFGALLHHPRF